MFFFKQKTAYEMRISDWSSDVCSSDLIKVRRWDASLYDLLAAYGQVKLRSEPVVHMVSRRPVITLDAALHHLQRTLGVKLRSEERRVGKECVRRVDLGGRRIIQKKKSNTHK